MRKIPNTLHEAILNTLDNCDKKGTVLEEEIGVDESLISRWKREPGHPSFAKMPVQLLLKVLNATNDDRILDYFEYKRGRFAAKFPCHFNDINDTSDRTIYSNACMNVLFALQSFISHSTTSNYKIVNEALMKVMAINDQVKKNRKKKNPSQLEISYE